METTKHSSDKSIPVYWVAFRYKNSLGNDDEENFFAVKGKSKKVDRAFKVMKRVRDGKVSIDGLIGDYAFEVIKDNCFRHKDLTIKHRLLDPIIIDLD